MHDSLFRQTLRGALLRIAAWARLIAHWAERSAAQPARPLPPWADGRRIDAVWRHSARRSLASGAALLIVAVIGSAAFSARVGARQVMPSRLARAAADRPKTDTAVGMASDPIPTTAPVATRKPVPTTHAPKPPAKHVALPTSVPGVRPDLPVGKGMWIYEPVKADGGDPAAIIARAKAVGLTHIYVRVGSSWDGFNGAEFLAQVIPAAHAANIKVFGWDFPRLIDWKSDVNRALAAINLRVGGQGIDGFAADIETASEGTYVTPASADAYGTVLRKYIAPSYPLIAVVPRPSPHTVAVKFPFDKVLAHFDAVAPMVYWLNREPDSDVAMALRDLAPFGKPIIPVGQAYDGAPEGGRAGVPTKEELSLFMTTAAAHGAAGVSFWSWQHADQQAWDAIRDAPQFRLAPYLARKS